MNDFSDQNNPGIDEKQEINGYHIKRIAHLRETSCFLYELEHIETGARHIHLSNSDKENTFSVAFKTVPADSTGVAHILEHTVLCGSKKYPVRDPFFSMLKRSLSTFMNAFTSSDWTMYPFSTQNRKDFYNLMDVYLDAVFFPVLSEFNFKQEGHRIEIEGDLKDRDSFRLVYKGVVYNEMKGAMSSPDQILIRSLFQSIYPDTTYGFNSGGDPAVIPQLTYDQLKAFHRRHYHPSNAFFYTYGNLPLKDHLSFIEQKVLRNFNRIDPGTDVYLQPRWTEPQKATYYYPLEKNEDPSKKCQVTMAWLTADVKDAFEVLILVLLEQILIGNSASPLRKALIDSGLGTALSDGTGFVSDHRDTLFSCGLKDVKATDAKAIEAICFNVFTSLVNKGIDKKLVESAIHQLEFHRKEVTNAPYPHGIMLFLIFAGIWFHGGDPVRTLQFHSDIIKIREKMKKGAFFEDRIKTYFIDNPHRVLLTLVPDPMIEEKQAEDVDRELEHIKAKMSWEDFDKLNQDAKALQQLQETREDISCLPTLAIEDIPADVEVAEETFITERAPAACYRQPTAGIFYFTAGCGIGSIDKRLIPLVPFFCYGFPRIGTARRGYADMVQWISAYTGGIGVSSNVRTRFDESGMCLPFVSINAKCLDRNIEAMFEILEELICQFDYTDLGRLRNLIIEYRAGMESKIVHNGHTLAMLLSARNFSPTAFLSEIWHGVHQLKTVKTITDELTDEKLNTLAEDLTRIGKTLLKRNNLRMAIIGEEKALEGSLPRVESMQRAIEEGTFDDFYLPELNMSHQIPREGWSTASAVSFVASSFATVRMCHRDAAVLAVLSKLLKSLYLHREIREKGGAYGGMSLYNPESGLFSFASYRDPHIINTLNVYKDAIIFIQSGCYDEEDIKEAILQICSDIDKPASPGARARKAFYRKMILLSDEERRRFKREVLAVTREKVVAVAEKYFDRNQLKQGIAVISGEEKFKEANKRLADQALKLYRI